MSLSDCSHCLRPLPARSMTPCRTCGELLCPACAQANDGYCPDCAGAEGEE